MVRIGLLVLAVLVLASCNLSSGPQTPEILPTPDTPLTCAQMVSAAVSTAGAACGGMGRNQVCYGNRLIEAVFRDETPTFETPGDRAALLIVQRLSTSPLDEQAQTWGIAFLKAQANIPDTLPGQNVLFLLYGDTALDGLSPQMNAVRLQTGIGPTRCPEAPPSAMLIQSPQGTSVTLSFNGASLTLGSTLYLTAALNGELTIATVEGTAVTSAFDITRVVRPGAQVRLPLGGADGLEVIGPPSEPEPFDAAAIRRAPLALLERGVTVPPPIAIIPADTLAATATVSIPQPPTAACIPRADWTAAYTIQRGDTLFGIATRFNLPVAELQQANCITNPNLIRVGQTLRVPFTLQPLPTSTLPLMRIPTATPPSRVTDTPLPFDDDFDDNNNGDDDRDPNKPPEESLRQTG